MVACAWKGSRDEIRYRDGIRWPGMVDDSRMMVKIVSLEELKWWQANDTKWLGMKGDKGGFGFIWPAVPRMMLKLGAKTKRMLFSTVNRD